MSRLYMAELLDRDGNPVAMLDVGNAQWRRQFNRANAIHFTFPAASDKTQEIKLAREYYLYRDGKKVARGKITRRDTAGSTWVLSAMSPEIHLESMVTPPEWGGLWEGQDVGAVVRDLLKEYSVRYANTETDYANAVEAHNVDIDTEPGTIMLGTVDGVDNPTGLPTRTYHESGHVIFQFDCEGHIGFERVRWSQDIGDVVRIKLAFRTGDGTSWGAWSDDLENRTDAETEGIDLRNLLHGDYSRYIQVRVTLETEDTETPLYDWDEAEHYEEQVFGFTPLFHGLELVYRKAGKLSLDAPDEFGIQVKRIHASTENHLTVLTDLADNYGLEFYVDTDLVLHVRKAPDRVADFDESEHLGTDYTDTFVFVEGRDINIAVLEDDDTDTVNVLYCYGAGRGPGRLALPEPLRDEVSIAEYGERVGEFTDTSITDRETLLQEGLKHLEERSTPVQSFRITTPWGDIPDLMPGDIVQVAVPRSNILVSARILDIEYTEDEGETLTIGLNTKLRNIIDRISDVEASLGKPESKSSLIPTPPTQFRAAGIYGAVTLSWLGQADSYIIEHSKHGEFGPWNVLESHVTTNRYTHSQLAVDSEHWYRVAKVIDGKVSPYTEPRKAKVTDVPLEDVSMDLTPPSAPTNLSGSSSTRTMPDGSLIWENTLSWDHIGEVKEFILERSDGTDSNFVPLATIPKGSKSWRDTDNIALNVSYFYRIKAVSQWGVESDPSNTVEVLQKGDVTKPAIPSTGPTITVGKKVLGVILTGSGDSSILHYVIERQEADADYSEETGKYSIPSSPNWGSWEVPPGGVVSARSWADQTVEYGKVYRYRYKAVNRSGIESDYSFPSQGAIPSKVGNEDAYFRWIQAEHYAQIRNNLVFSETDSLDESHPMELLFYVPSETDRIVKAYLVAKGLRFRAYSQGTEGGGGSVVTSSTEGTHTHPINTTTITKQTGDSSDSFSVNVPAHSHDFTVSGDTDDAGSHSHSVTLSGSTDGHTHNVNISGDTEDAGYHSHGVDVSGSTDGHSHGFYADVTPSLSVSGTTDSSSDSFSGSGSTDSGGEHSHAVNIQGTTDSSSDTVTVSGSTSPSIEHSHSVNIQGTTNTGGGGLVGGITHGHQHTFSYLAVTNAQDTGSHQHTVDIPSHSHGIAYGIYEDTVPNGVKLYVDNGDGYGEPYTLALAPSDYTEYDLISGSSVPKHNGADSEMDLTGIISGTGWKRLKFTSNRLGRIEAHLVLKVDVTA